MSVNPLLCNSPFCLSCRAQREKEGEIAMINAPTRSTVMAKTKDDLKREIDEFVNNTTRPDAQTIEELRELAIYMNTLSASLEPNDARK